jgi:hypothetical protein
MSKDITYKQCRVQRTIDETTTSTQVAWLPAKYAVVGKILEIEGVDGWLVLSTGKSVLDAQAVKVLERSARNHRKHTDI